MQIYLENFFKNKNLKFFIGIFFIISILLIHSMRPKWYLEFRGHLPRSNKILKDHFLRLRNSFNLAKNNKQKFSFDKEEITSAFHNIVKKRIPAKNFLYYYYYPSVELYGLPGGYIDYINPKEIIGTNGKGEMFIYKTINNQISKVNSNLDNIFDSQNYKGKVIPGLFGRFGVRDLFVDRDKKLIYASIFVDISGDGCYGLGIYRSKYNNNNLNSLDNNFLNFKPFFITKECNKNFNGHASGGRIKKFNNKIVITVGSLDFSKSSGGNINDYKSLNNMYLPQRKDNALGKVISIDQDGKNYEVISYGHRNQQGLAIIDNKIFISEHGPKGGDEINIVRNGQHYGWPFYSYGFNYGEDYGNSSERYRMPHDNGFIKPIFYFTPSIGISELIFYRGPEFKYWNNKIIVSSLKYESIFLLDYDSEKEKILSSERIKLGHRIRDLLLMPDGKIYAVTDDRFLLLLSNTPISKHSYSTKIPIKLLNSNKL